MVQVASRRPLTKWMWVKSEINACKICGGHRSSGADSTRVLRLPLSVSFHHFSIPTQFYFASIIPSFLCPRSVFPCQYHSTISPYPLSFPLLVSFHHFSVLAQFSHVSIIPPFLRTHLVFLCQHFSTIFPSSFCVAISASFRQCSILTFIHLPITPITLHH